jgi:uncharacterized RDD family membrane protein YckC
MGEILFCNKCGVANAPGAQFCSNCGAAMNPAAVAAPVPAAGTLSPQGGANVPTPLYQAVSTGARYGGFWIRVVAAIIDAIIVRVVVAPIGIMFGGMSWLAGMGGGLPHMGVALLGSGITFLLVVAGGWLYEAFLESSSYQATLGKMIFGMKVTDLQGNRISFARATGRHFAKILSTMILFIGFIMVGFTERKQGLHDMLAGTLVRRS